MDPDQPAHLFIICIQVLKWINNNTEVSPGRNLEMYSDTIWESQTLNYMVIIIDLCLNVHINLYNM